MDTHTLTPPAHLANLCTLVAEHGIDLHPEHTGGNCWTIYDDSGHVAILDPDATGAWILLVGDDVTGDIVDDETVDEHDLGSEDLPDIDYLVALIAEATR